MPFPYASVLHVANLNAARGTYTATSKPTASAVHEFLEEIAGAIDGKLRKAGYALPVPTGATSALKFLQGVNALGGAYKVEVSAEVRDDADLYKEMYESALKMIDDGDVELDIDTDTSQSNPRSGFTATRVFSLDMEL